MPQVVQAARGEQVPAELGSDLDVDRQRLGQVQPCAGAAHLLDFDHPNLPHRFPVDVERPLADRRGAAQAHDHLLGAGGCRHPHCGAQTRVARDLLHPPGHPLRIQMPAVRAGEHQVAELDGPTVLVGQHPVVPGRAHGLALVVLDRPVVEHQPSEHGGVEVDLPLP
ncbi:hypothetical protein [Parafrankia soli]|uniref:hypothetical protein n=1 Tax=Parafrankia soli TaxID=2599596 RepID=UPI001F52015D|nr:hypothetical protein [Parafrankia soli]